MIHQDDFDCARVCVTFNELTNILTTQSIMEWISSNRRIFVCVYVCVYGVCVWCVCVCVCTYLHNKSLTSN